MRNFLIMLAFVLSLTQMAFAKEWNGIKPLQTTRAEVIKLLGEPKPPDHEVLGEHFAVNGENVYIIWIRADCRGEEEMIAGTPPTDLNVVVNQITVDPKSFLTKEDVKKIDPPKESLMLPGFFISGAHNCLGSGGKWTCSVSNGESGFGYGTNTEGQVDRLYYNASEKEQKAWNEKLLPCVKGMN